VINFNTPSAVVDEHNGQVSQALHALGIHQILAALGGEDSSGILMISSNFQWHLRHKG